ncbi:bactofilin family protein [Paucidesulfovibrio longus]|uniref:bactofilin family protein n=1 Tax=Paucidesulfovibrio longus TaxID=889 RepID=UPI0003B303FF|nr:polymer-forming cytoskeletal protein [Paucidesulfovibrio longus]
MGFFKKNLSGAGERSSNDLNAFLGAGTEYSGRLDFVGTVRIDGMFHGEISSDGTLVLGKDAMIKGQIRIGTLISNGQIYGDVSASIKAVMQKHSILDGSLRTPALVVEEGATIEGDVEMSDRDHRGALVVSSTKLSVEGGTDSGVTDFDKVEDAEAVEVG